VRRLLDNAGTPRAEVADDRVTAQRLNPGEESGPGGPLVWREIEIELADSADSAGSALLTAAGQLLRDAGARPARSASKLGRLLSTEDRGSGAV
jgi:hypothetical protein